VCYLTKWILLQAFHTHCLKLRIKMWSVPPLRKHCIDCYFMSLHRDVTCHPCTRVQVAWCWPPNFVVLARQAHTAGKLMNIMQQMYQSLVLPWNRDIEWPTRCHLSVCDCFLLWCLKSEVYIIHPRNFAELSSTSEEIVAVPVKII
jgi:hypothetical protein